MGLIFRLLHRFGDPLEIRDQQADEEWKAFLRRQGDNCEVPGAPEREELLRLLGEEIASVKEEFAYAEKANEERAELERDACLAPEGETWVMLLRQEASLDQSIDRKVRILLRLRKELHDFPVALPREDDGTKTEGTEKILDHDIMSEHLQGVETADGEEGNCIAKNKSKGKSQKAKGKAAEMNEQCGNVYENTGAQLKAKG